MRAYQTIRIERDYLNCTRDLRPSLTKDAVRRRAKRSDRQRDLRFEQRADQPDPPSPVSQPQSLAGPAYELLRSIFGPIGPY